MTTYKLPDIPGNVAGKKARLTIGDDETIVEGVISTITVRTGKFVSAMIISFMADMVTAHVHENTPHVLEVED